MKILILIINISLLFSTNITFIANEGNFGTPNGSISMVFDDGTIQETGPLGDIVQALEVWEDKLIVLVNNSNKVMIFDITPQGLEMPGIEIDTNGSSPRDLVIVDDKVYFTNWYSMDVKVLNLSNNTIEESIPVNGLPEDIIFDGQYLWIAIPHSDLYFNSGNTIPVSYTHLTLPTKA